MITLYTSPTPNGWKASITLEEMGLDDTVKAIDLAKGEQKEDWLALNPNEKFLILVSSSSHMQLPY